MKGAYLVLAELGLEALSQDLSSTLPPFPVNRLFCLIDTVLFDLNVYFIS